MSHISIRLRNGKLERAYEIYDGDPSCERRDKHIIVINEAWTLLTGCVSKLLVNARHRFYTRNVIM